MNIWKTIDQKSKDKISANDKEDELFRTILYLVFEHLLFGIR